MTAPRRQHAPLPVSFQPRRRGRAGVTSGPVRVVCCWVALLSSGGPAGCRSDGAGSAAGPDQPGPASYDEIPLAIADDLDPDPGVVEVRVQARPAEIAPRPGSRLPMWGYDGRVPGPLIRGRRGDRLIVHFENQLPEPTTIHWHGLRVPNAMDGVATAQEPVPPGGTFRYEFVLLDAGTFWYHPHHLSARQVERGLYAPIVVEERAETPAERQRLAALGRPVLLVLSDTEGVAERDDGGPTDAAVRNGREGPLVLVNGRVRPAVAVPRGARQRWQLINAARSRFFQLEVAGHRLTRIGGDGGLLEAPAPPVERLLLVPGERADVVLELTGAVGDRLAVRASAYDRGGDAPASPMEILDLDLIEGSPGPALPARLRDVERLTLAPGAPAQTIRIGERPEGFVINEQAAGSHPHLRARVGETHLFTVTNHTRFDHPFHLHGFFFQRLDQQTLRPAEPVEWKDTLNLPALSSAVLAVHFDDRPGLWMFHCHILDHADLGLMGMLEVGR
jgi:FtsP/CotA-like multicopper oxidase with cupredoxin domain